MIREILRLGWLVIMLIMFVSMVVIGSIAGFHENYPKASYDLLIAVMLWLMIRDYKIGDAE